MLHSSGSVLNTRASGYHDPLLPVTPTLSRNPDLIPPKRLFAVIRLYFQKSSTHTREVNVFGKTIDFEKINNLFC